MRIGMFTEAFDTEGEHFSTKFDRVGENTGNLIFMRALKRLFSPRLIDPAAACTERAHELADCGAFITTELIWIREGDVFENVERTLRVIGDRPLIPISVGLQADVRRPDFKLQPRTLRLLSELSERCVIGTRGDYTAEILSKNGVRRLRPIGCPSVFYKKRYRFKRRGGDPRCVCGFSTLWRDLSASELRLLRYFMKHGLDFVEQTGLYSFSQHEEFDRWLTAKRRIFFSTDEWDRFLDGFDFYMGMRFHGGIAAMQRGLPALFVTSDSRTAELCEFFSLPSITLGEFDEKMSLSYYMNLAYPDKFLKRLPALKENFREFARENRLKVNL